MRARELRNQRLNLGDGRSVRIVIWEVPEPKKPSAHSYKYRLAFIVNDVCVLRYDNELGKGDHRHEGRHQTPYIFSTLDKLIDDFMNDIENWRA